MYFSLYIYILCYSLTCTLLCSILCAILPDYIISHIQRDLLGRSSHSDPVVVPLFITALSTRYTYCPGLPVLESSSILAIAAVLEVGTEYDLNVSPPKLNPT